MKRQKLIADIMDDPTRFYRAPSDVVRDRRFSDDERLQILGAWERDIRDQDGNAQSQQLRLVSGARVEVERRSQSL